MPTPKKAPRTLRPGATIDTVRAIALALPGVEEGTSYGTPAWKAKGKLMARLREDGETLVVRIEPDARDLLMRSEPETFFVTDHYVGHPWVLVKLPRVERGALAALLEEAWRLVAPKRLASAKPAAESAARREEGAPGEGPARPGPRAPGEGFGRAARTRARDLPRAARGRGARQPRRADVLRAREDVRHVRGQPPRRRPGGPLVQGPARRAAGALRRGSAPLLRAALRRPARLGGRAPRPRPRLGRRRGVRGGGARHGHAGAPPARRGRPVTWGRPIRQPGHALATMIAASRAPRVQAVAVL